MPVITGICTKWLKNSQQNFPPFEFSPLPRAGGKEKGKQRLLMPETHNHQQQSPEVKRQPGNTTIEHSGAKRRRNPQVHSSCLPTLSFSSTPEHCPQWAIQITSRLQSSHTGTILKVSIASLSHQTVTGSSNCCTQLLGFLIAGNSLRALTAREPCIC